MNKKAEEMQVAMLLTVIGEEAQEVFAIFTWKDDNNQNKMDIVLDKFGTYCQPWKKYHLSSIMLISELRSLVSCTISIVQFYKYCREAISLHQMKYYVIH